MSRGFIRILILSASGIAALAAGLFILQQPIQQQIAVQSANKAFHSRRINLLVLGYQNDEGNSDTVLLAHLDIDQRTATLVSIPRDTWVSIPGHGHGKINEAMGDGGPELSSRVVSTLLGRVPIDGTLAVQPQDAKQLVDAMGGLNINVERDMDYDDNNGNLHIHLKKGEQYLTGGQVVEYVRFRHDAEADWGRVRRQQQVLRALCDQMGRPEHWIKVPKLLALARKDLKTTLNDQQLATLLEIYRNVPQNDIRSFTLPGRASWVGDASVVLVDPMWASLIGKLTFSKEPPPQDPIEVANATGTVNWNQTVVSALRGGGWNVQTFVDQPAKQRSALSGNNASMKVLQSVFVAADRRGGTQNVLTLGADLAPQKD